MIFRFFRKLNYSAVCLFVSRNSCIHHDCSKHINRFNYMQMVEEKKAFQFDLFITVYWDAFTGHLGIFSALCYACLASQAVTILLFFIVAFFCLFSYIVSEPYFLRFAGVGLYAAGRLTHYAFIKKPNGFQSSSFSCGTTCAISQTRRVFACIAASCV